jgi:hypothetical protein
MKILECVDFESPAAWRYAVYLSFLKQGLIDD